MIQINNNNIVRTCTVHFVLNQLKKNKYKHTDITYNLKLVSPHSQTPKDLDQCSGINSHQGYAQPLVDGGDSFGLAPP